MSLSRIDKLRVLKNAVATALQQTLCRFSLWLACHGILLPWYSWAESKVSIRTVERYRRRAMVARLKASRFKLSRGPFVVRGVIESVYTFLRYMQFPVTISIKFSSAILVCLLPFIIFFIVRIYLPVPQRLVRARLNVNMKTVSESETVQPLIQRKTKSSAQDVLPLTGFFSFTETDIKSGEGYLVQGKGGSHEESWRGWRLTSDSELLARFKSDAAGKTLRVKYRVIPNEEVDAQCRIDITSGEGEFLFSSGFDLQRGTGFGFHKSPLTRRLQEKLMPDLARMKSGITGRQATLNIRGNNPSLTFKVSRMDQGDPRVCSVLVYGFEQIRQAGTQPLQAKRSLLMFLFKSLHAGLAADSQVMPWMSGILRSPVGYIFNQHHALDLRDDNSFKQILGLSPEQSGLSANPENQLTERLRNNGYRVVFIGDYDSEDARAVIRPDVAIRIANETYQPQLALNQLFRSLEEESSTPLFVLVRLRGMQTQWWPVVSNLEIQKMFMGGQQRGIADTLLFGDAKSLDSELSLYFGQLKTSGVFSKFDFLLTAEKGLDLGLNLLPDDRQSGTFLGDLILNQESLRVPLIYIPASGRGVTDNQMYKYIHSVTTHSDLSRSLWESLGLTDSKFPVEARRLWQSTDPIQSRIRGAFSAVRDSSSQFKSYPLQSRIQQGVLFVDPESAGGFLKYVTQPVPFRVSVPDSYGWPSGKTVSFASGEQFRQVSRRGTREEILGRVNSNFVREARRVIRVGRSLPLHFRLEFQENMPVDLVFTEQGRSVTQVKAELPEGLRLTSTAAQNNSFIHRVSGNVREGDRMDLLGSLTQLQFSENRESSVFVACPEAYLFSAQALNAAVVQKSLCLLEIPSAQRVNYLKMTGKKIIKVWLIEDEKRSCVKPREGDEPESSECTFTETAE